MLSVACFLQGSSLLTMFVTATTKQDTWIAVIAGYILSLPVLALYIYFIKAYPGKTFVEINEVIFGRVIGKVFSALYIFHLMSLTWLNTMQVSSFYSGYLMPETPSIVFAVMLLFVCGWAVSRGVETLTRYSFLLVLLTFLVSIGNTAALLGEFNLSNFLPVFSLPFKKYVQATHTMAIVPYLEIYSFLMIAPSVQDAPKIGKSFFKGLSLGAVTMLIVVTRNTAILGPVASISTVPSLETVRLIDIGQAITRVEILYAFLLAFLLFFKVSITYYAVVLGIAQLFKLRSYAPLVPVMGAIFAVMSVIAFDRSMESAYWGQNLAAVYSTFFELVLPLVALFIALFKKIDILKT